MSSRNCAKNASSKIQQNTKIHSARRILKQYGNAPPGTLKCKEKGKLKWARSILQQVNTKGKATTVTTVDNQRSSKPVATTKDHKDTSFDPTVLKFNKVIAIIDKCSNHITCKKWKIIESALASTYLKVMKDYPGEPPHCKDLGWHDDRYKLIGCTNDRSVFLLNAALKEVGKRKNVNIVAAYKEDIITTPHAVAFLPVKLSEINTILEIINTNNSNLFVDRWNILQIDEVINGWKQVIFKLDALSMIPLKELNNTIYYMSSAVKLYVYRNESEKIKTFNLIKRKNTELMKCTFDLNTINTNETDATETINPVQFTECKNIKTVQASNIIRELNNEIAQLMEIEKEEADVICVDDSKHVDVIIIDDDDDDEAKAKYQRPLLNK